MDSLNVRIKQCRLQKELNQPELAKIMNVTKQTVSNWENGNRIPDTSTLYKLANFFDISVDYLLGRTDDPNVKVYETEIDGEEYTIGLDKSYPHNLSPKDVNELIKKLETVGFDVNKLIEQIKNDDSKDD